MAEPEQDAGTALQRALEEIRERVTSRSQRNQDGSPPDPPDLMRLFHARDAALGKVAAIGTVNPRRGGPVNAAIQAAKRLVARLLDWHVREQIEFNRAAVMAIEESLEILNRQNHLLLAFREESKALGEEARTLREAQSTLAGWAERAAQSEVRLLRTASEMQTTFQHRVSLMEAAFRELLDAERRAYEGVAARSRADFEAAIAGQQAEIGTAVAKVHADFEAALAARTGELAAAHTREMAALAEEYERRLHNEVRVLRQGLSARPGASVPKAATPPSAAGTAPAIDWIKFADRFRGPVEEIKQRQRFYLPYFEGTREVIDLGCGRGEFLELAREAGLRARGVDFSPEMVALCRSRGLDVEQADLFDFLGQMADGSASAFFCAQVVEHLAPARIPELVRLAAARLERGGRLIIETPNPASLAIFASHFYIDPTHTRPVPASLLAFYYEEAGLGSIEVRALAPAADSMPALAELPAAVREAFFGGLDYAIIGRRL